jgi:uncharacterized membrane protein YedE/YeeE
VNTPTAPSASGPRPFSNPYVAGVALGLTLLVSFLTLGTGLGASGAIARGAAQAAHAVAPAAVEENGYLGGWFADGPAVEHYLVAMAVGVLVGGFVSARLARRTGVVVERGPRSGIGRRLVLALVGGALVGFASRMAGGCTSGQALTGGALLLEGSWAFTAAVFAGGFGAAWFVRKEWI